MSVVKTVIAEIYGLFVDDGKLALTILLWLAIIGAILHFAPSSAPWIGALLAFGLVAILVESAWRRSRSGR